MKKNRKNLFTIWLDYQKAFDSVSHKWLIQALKQEKLPDDLIEAIYQLTKCWQTKATLETLNGSIETEINQIFERNPARRQLECYTVYTHIKPLIIPLKKDKRIQNQECNRFHNTSFFIDDLKTYAGSVDEGKKQLDIITTFSKGINMNFGLRKCS